MGISLRDTQGSLGINGLYIPLNWGYTNENITFTTNNFFTALTDLVLALIIIYNSIC